MNTEEGHTFFTGAMDDFRSDLDKQKDYTSDEVASYAPVSLAELSFESIPHVLIPDYVIRDQDGSGSCVAQTRALMHGIERYREQGVFTVHSASDLYGRRTNKPHAGMIGVDAFNIPKKFGITLESLMPSQGMSEEQINKVPRFPVFEEVGKAFLGQGFAQVPFDADKIAAIMAGNVRRGIQKPMMTWYRFPYAEWAAVPKLSNDIKATAQRTPETEKWVHHSITALIAGTYNGEVAFLSQDSWGHHSTTQKGFRIITASYLAKRMTFCAYQDDFGTVWSENPNTQEVAKPRHTFNKNLKYNTWGDPDVVALQDVLKYEQLFPINQPSTGNYGIITANAVVAWQKKHMIGTVVEIDALSGVRSVVGAKSRAKLNELYSR